MWPEVIREYLAELRSEPEPETPPELAALAVSVVILRAAMHRKPVIPERCGLCTPERSRELCAT